MTPNPGPGSAEAGGGAPRTFQAVLERIVFRNEETGWTVASARARDGGERVTLAGEIAGVDVPDRVEVTGLWVVHPRFGRQFQVAECRFVPPSTAEEIRDYLATGVVKGIGPKTADSLVGRFGEHTLEILDRDPARIALVPGLRGKRGRAIRDAWQGHKGVRDTFFFLHGLGIGAARAARIRGRYGAGTIERVRQDPYALADEVFGIGFVTADRIALGLGVAADAPRRLEAGLEYVLREACESSGHVCLPADPLAGRAASLLGVDPAAAAEALETVVARGRIARDEAHAADVYPPALLDAERRAAERLSALARAPAAAVLRAARAGLVSDRAAIRDLTDAQRGAVRTALSSKVSIITGGPGVGKTTLLKGLLRLLRDAGARIALAAPTGRAAKRLAETTGEPAKTIHRLLLYDPKTNEWGRNRDAPLPADFVCVDEASMIDVPLMARLADAIPDPAAALLVGDADQLPSVGPGSVLKDLIQCGRFPVARLTEIFRQARESLIVANAHRVNRGEMPLLPTAGPGDPWGDFLFLKALEAERAADYAVRLASEAIPRRLGLDPVDGVQVLVPMHKGACGTEALNRALRRVLNPSAPEDAPFAPGDKVMQIKNDYEKEVFNGDVGRVEAVDSSTRGIRVAFPERSVEYAQDEAGALLRAYAISIHKSQGSEYPAVVVALLREHHVLLQRNLLYTAITRGRRFVAVVGDPSAVASAVHRAEAAKRNGHLRERLAERQGATGGSPTS